jgi:hypothetical protein
MAYWKSRSSQSRIGSSRVLIDSTRQRLQIMEKGGIITLVPEVPIKLLKGALKGMSKTDLREKKGRS